MAQSSSSGSPATSCLSQADTSQESSEARSRKSLGSFNRSAAMKKAGGNGGGGGAAMAAVAASKKQHHHQQQGGGVAQQQASLVASLQAEAVRQQQVVSTTFVEADTSSFRELVQKLTGVAEDSQEKLPITLPSRHASRESSAHQREVSSVTWESHRDSIPMYSHVGVMSGAGQDCGRGGGMSQRDATLMMLDERGFVRSSVSQEAYANWERMIAGRNLPGGLNSVDAYRTIGKVEPLAVRRSAFKMPVGKKLELKQGSSSLRRDAVANAMFPNYWNGGSPGYPGVSPRSDVLRSPVTTLTRDPFDSHSFGPGTPCSYDNSSVTSTSLSPRFGHEGCSPRTPGSTYDHGFNIIDKRTRSLVQDVAQEFASCNMGPAGAASRGLLAQPEEPQEYVLHPPLERRNGEPQLLSLFPLASEKA